MNRVIVFIIAALFFVGCSGGEEAYEREVTFEKGIWDRFEKLDFEFPVTHTDRAYDFVMVLEYDVNFPEDKIPFHVIMQMPNGEERIKEYHPRIRSNKGMIYGRITDGRATLEVPLREEHRFTEQGTAKLNIECFYPKYTIQGIYKVGVVMRRAAKKST
ncbi:MAG: hypothetical protein CSA04_03400 [Bacteroidetes bacterium]|nr:MAG: hypothetical protein CSA04_03400 [Bacteroidota bacterium]